MKYLFIILVISILAIFDLSSNEKKDQINTDTKIYIVKYRWHTGIILNRSHIKDYMPVLGNEFILNTYIEIGWGDKEFYMAEKETIGLALKALFIPTESVIHIHGFNENPEWHFRNDKLSEVNLSADNLIILANSLNNSFATDENGNQIKVRKGLVANSTFYLSNEKYHLFKTCNVWTARKLKTAGVDVRPAFSVTSSGLMRQLKNSSNK